MEALDPLIRAEALAAGVPLALLGEEKSTPTTRTGAAPGRTSRLLPEPLKRPVYRCESCEDRGMVSLSTGTVECPDCPSCRTCGDAHFVRFQRPVRHPEFGMAHPCPDCTAVAVAEPGRMGEDEALARFRVPLKYRSYRLEQWMPADGEPRRKVDEWLRSWPPTKPSLFLFGEPGTGKSTLAVGAQLRAYQRYGVLSRFVSMVSLIDRYRATQDADRATETATDVDQELDRAPLLVIDDYGAERATGFAEERAYGLFERRYNSNMPTIVTSNAELISLSPRVKSRLSEGYFVPLRGADHRPAVGRAS